MEPSVAPQPFNTEIMQPDKFVADHYLQPVTSTLIRVPASAENHPEGFFSEAIFGPINSPERLVRFGYVDLNTTIISPPIYRFIKSIAPWHEDVMAGKLRAHYDPKTKTLTRSTDGTGDTGYSFYLSIYPELKFKDSASISRQERVKVINKWRKQSLYTKYLVLPAGLRELTMSDTGRLIVDDINKLYIQLLASAQSLDMGITSPIYDPIKFAVQSKAVEIYSYIDSIMSGKKGFLQNQYGNRRVALGTRNVVSAEDYACARPDSPQFLKADETRIGLFQVAKATQPAVLYYLRTQFFDQIFGQSQDVMTISVMDPKSHELVYIDIDPDTRERIASTDGIYTAINKFKSFSSRKKPLTVPDVTGKEYYFYAVYTAGDKIYVYQSASALAEMIGITTQEVIAHSHFLTWIEALYMATYQVSVGKFAHMTRYPVLGAGSCYPSRIHLASTKPALVVTLMSPQTNTPVMTFPEYPILEGATFQDGMAITSTHLGPTGGDHDGDTFSANVTLTEDACAETEAYMNSTRSILDTNDRLVGGDATDLMTLAFFAFSHLPEDL